MKRDSHQIMVVGTHMGLISSRFPPSSCFWPKGQGGTPKQEVGRLERLILGPNPCSHQDGPSVEATGQIQEMKNKIWPYASNRWPSREHGLSLY